MIQEVPAIDRHLFDGAMARLRLQPEETLVIGATTDAVHDYLLGHRFFLGVHADGPFETVIFLTPKREQAQRGMRVTTERS
jgi:hypothetical protein